MAVSVPPHLLLFQFISPPPPSSSPAHIVLFSPSSFSLCLPPRINLTLSASSTCVTEGGGDADADEEGGGDADADEEGGGGRVQHPGAARGARQRRERRTRRQRRHLQLT